MPNGKSADAVKGELQGVLASELTSRKIAYTRSDGSQWTLSLKDVLDRMPDFEMAYNPNDCAELRWGAAENSQEAATCKRRRRRRRKRKCRPTIATGSANGTGRRIRKAVHHNAADVAKLWRGEHRKAVRRFAASEQPDRPMLGSSHDIEQRLGHSIVRLHHRRVGGKTVACDHLADHLLGEIDIGRGDKAVLVGEGCLRIGDRGRGRRDCGDGRLGAPPALSVWISSSGA